MDIKIDLIQRCFKIHHSRLDSFLKSLNNFGNSSDQVEASHVFLRPGISFVSEDCYDVVVNVRSKYNCNYIVEQIEEKLRELWETLK